MMQRQQGKKDVTFEDDTAEYYYTSSYGQESTTLQTSFSEVTSDWYSCWTDKICSWIVPYLAEEEERYDEVFDRYNDRLLESIDDHQSQESEREFHRPRSVDNDQRDNYSDHKTIDKDDTFSTNTPSNSSYQNDPNSQISESLLHDVYNQYCIPNNNGAILNTQEIKLKGGAVYEGSIKYSISREGSGKTTFPNGDVYIGEYNNDYMEGEGTSYYANGEKYHGSFKRNKREGQGTYTYNNGNWYEGQWVGGRKEGRGTYFFNDGGIYVGNFLNGKANGFGQMTQGKDFFEGYWENGILIQKSSGLQDNKRNDESTAMPARTCSSPPAAVSIKTATSTSSSKKMRPQTAPSKSPSRSRASSMGKKVKIIAPRRRSKTPEKIKNEPLVLL